eukprot:scaffold2213_cov444-Prasinococcus_capsulatus_cf.AAC.20
MAAPRGAARGAPTREAGGGGRAPDCVLSAGGGAASARRGVRPRGPGIRAGRRGRAPLRVYPCPLAPPPPRIWAPDNAGARREVPEAPPPTDARRSFLWNRRRRAPGIQG